MFPYVLLYTSCIRARHLAFLWYICYSDEPVLNHNYYPKSKVYIKTHALCCTFYGFSHMSNGMYPQLSYNTESLYYTMFNLAISILPSSPLATTALFTVFIVLLFSRMSKLKSYRMWIFQINFFHLPIYT